MFRNSKVKNRFSKVALAIGVTVALSPSLLFADDPVDLSQLYEYQQELEPMPPGWLRMAESSKRVLRRELRGNVKPINDAKFDGGVAIFPYSENAYYQVVCGKGQITRIKMQPMEYVKDAILGDTERWNVTLSQSNDGVNRQQSVYVIPKRERLHTSLVVETNLRTYYFMLSSAKTFHTPTVAFSYPVVTKPQRRKEPQETAMPKSTGYTITPRADFFWKPEAIWDDGVNTYIRFNDGVKQRKLPVVYNVEGDELEIVNFQVEGTTFIVGRLMDHFVIKLSDRHEANVYRNSYLKTYREERTDPLRFGGRGEINLRNQIGTH